MTDRIMHYDNTASPPSEEAAICEFFGKVLNDWARGDSKAHGSRFTDDADYVAFDGSHQRTRRDRCLAPGAVRQVAQGDASYGPDRGPRFLSPEVAFGHATGGMVKVGKTKPSPERDSIRTFVAVRGGNEWRFAACHNSRVRLMDRGAVAFLIWALTDRLWRTFASRRKDNS